MKCPKCGYISFDFNPACPKCNRDLTAEQEHLHLPSFRPDPPSLLGALLGEANESGVGIQVDSGGEFETPHTGMRADMGMEEAVPGAEEISFDDSGELNIGLESGDEKSEIGKQGLSMEVEDEETGLGDSGELDIRLDTEGDVSFINMEGPDIASGEVISENGSDEGLIGDIALDAGVVSFEQTGMEASVPGAGGEPEEITLDLDDLSAGGTEASLEILAEGSQADEEEFTLDLDDTGPESPELTGAAGPETPAAKPGKGREKTIHLDAPAVEENLLNADSAVEMSDAGEEEFGIDLLEIDEGTDGEADEIELNLEDLKINDSGELQIDVQTASGSAIETPLDMGDFPLGGMSGESGPSEAQQGQEDELAIDLDEFTLDVEPVSQGAGQKEIEETPFDLEDLNLELELEKSDDNPSS